MELTPVVHIEDGSESFEIIITALDKLNSIVASLHDKSKAARHRLSLNFFC